MGTMGVFAFMFFFSVEEWQGKRRERKRNGSVLHFLLLLTTHYVNVLSRWHSMSMTRMALKSNSICTHGERRY